MSLSRNLGLLLPALMLTAGIEAQLPGLNAGVVTASVDGSAYSAQVSIATVDDEGTLVLTSLSNEVQIQVPNATVGTFPLRLDADGGLVDVIIGLRVGWRQVTPVSGAIVIDRLDASGAAGRFDFHGKDVATEAPVEVTGGQFEVALIRTSAGP